MQQVMVITSIIVIMRGMVPLKVVRDIDNHSETIEIGKDASQRDQPTVARIVGRFGGDDPTRQEMSDRSHWSVKWFKGSKYVESEKMRINSPLLIISGLGIFLGGKELDALSH